jgi:hypothetical protein
MRHKEIIAVHWGKQTKPVTILCGQNVAGRQISSLTLCFKQLNRSERALLVKNKLSMGNSTEQIKS